MSSTRGVGDGVEKDEENGDISRNERGKDATSSFFVSLGLLSPPLVFFSLLLLLSFLQPPSFECVPISRRSSTLLLLSAARFLRRLLSSLLLICDEECVGGRL